MIRSFKIWLKRLLRLPDTFDFFNSLELELYHPKDEVNIIQTRTMVIIHDANTRLDDIIKDFRETIEKNEFRDVKISKDGEVVEWS